MSEWAVLPRKKIPDEAKGDFDRLKRILHNDALFQMGRLEVTEIEALAAAIESMVKKAEDPRQQARFKDYTRTLLMRFDDLNTEFVVRFDNGKPTVRQEGIENPDMTVTTDSQTVIGILQGDVSPMRAFMSGKIRADGPARDLMKLQHLLKK